MGGGAARVCPRSITLLGSRDPSPLTCSVDGRDPAQIVYTSGTESLPKGAMLTHDAVISNYVSCIVDGEYRARTTRCFTRCRCTTARSSTCSLARRSIVGTTNVITGKPTADNLLSLMERAPDHLVLCAADDLDFPAALAAVRQDRPLPPPKGYYGASIMPVEVLKEMQRRLPHVRLWNLYGQTEIAPLATVLKPRRPIAQSGLGGQAGAQRRNPHRR